MTPDAFREALARLHFTQQEAAKRLDVNERTIRRYAKGQRTIKDHIRLALERLEQTQ
jgi:DNA-binding XRE family transcriptional regulator